MKEIPLTQGQVALVDDEDYDYLMQWKWYAAMNCGHFYARRSHRASDRLAKRSTIPMHTVIMSRPDGCVVDHINGDTLDNQKSNLRVCTNAENIRNSKSRVGSTSKYLGVSKYTQSYRKKDGTVVRYHSWLAQINANRNKEYLGCYKNEEDAALAYNDAAKKYYGEFARLNVIPNNGVSQ